ncbi:MAG TPA: LysR substrate-binding domain-containing protein [Burkholderiaceae bacterium]|nr:LysR substrate-binding domain-containing protein [Burkholderiaceae bacterium]
MSALPSMRQLSYLVKLSEKLNFTQAAEASFVTQSTLSGGIQELERQLGAQLVERDRQHVRMTPIGEEVVARARVLLSMAADLVAHASRAAEPMTGLVRLGAIPTIAPFMLPQLVRAVRERHPKLSVALREDTTARVLAQVRDGSLDFAVIALPYDTTGLRVRELFDDELWLIAAEGDPAAKPARPSVAQLDAQRLLLLEEGHCLRSHTLEGCGLAERANATGIEASSVTTLVQMVEEGLGIALLPEMALRANLLVGTSVIARPIGAPAPRRGIALVARGSTARAAEFEALAEIAARLGKEPRRRRPRTAAPVAAGADA